MLSFLSLVDDVDDSDDDDDDDDVSAVVGYPPLTVVVIRKSNLFSVVLMLDLSRNKRQENQRLCQINEKRNVSESIESSRMNRINRIESINRIEWIEWNFF
jgi:hypothetical protein